MEAIEDVILGCANQAGEDNRNIARMSSLLAGLPASVPGETVNRLCASGMSAILHASRAIRCGEGDLFLAGGIEHMTRAPLVMSKAEQAYGRAQSMFDSTMGWRFVNPRFEQAWGVESMGQTAENLVELFSISRVDQDAFANWSQQKTAQAQQSGRLAKEIVPLEIPQRKKDPIVFETDEFPRPSTTGEGLAKLSPVFRKQGTVTAGNASGINDGAAAVLVASQSAVDQYGIAPKVRVLSSAVCGVEPRIMGIGPVEASRKALARAGLTLSDIDIIEINEAFAAQVLACLRELGIEDDDPRVNPNGGAISLGHPLGMTGTRLAITAMHELIEKKKRYALCTMCVGVGQGLAAILERVE